MRATQIGEMEINGQIRSHSFHLGEAEAINEFQAKGFVRRVIPRH